MNAPGEHWSDRTGKSSTGNSTDSKDGPIHSRQISPHNQTRHTRPNFALPSRSYSNPIRNVSITCRTVVKEHSIPDIRQVLVGAKHRDVTGLGRSPSSDAMMPITTSSSIRLKAIRRRVESGRECPLSCKTIRREECLGRLDQSGQQFPKLRPSARVIDSQTPFCCPKGRNMLFPPTGYFVNFHPSAVALTPVKPLCLS
jgi:hypothetical protein